MERIIPERKSGGERPVDRRIRRSRDGLRAALLGLLTEHGFEDITVRDIADRANVGYTTFFRHFAGKDALLDAVVMGEVQRLTDRALPIYDADNAPGACLALCAYVDEHRPLWAALLTGGAAAKVREAMLVSSRKLTAIRSADHALPADLGAALAVAVILELLSWWLRQADPWPAGKVATVLCDRIIAPATAR